MPKRTDIKKILILGSGPIVIGQACEFDYSGTQAIKALRNEGYKVVLVNSNPATIMTDPEFADATYIEPLTPDIVEKVIEKERPEAILPTLGGQTALNLAVALGERGTLEKYKVELIGAKLPAIKKAEDRRLFRKTMQEIGLDLPQSGYAYTIEYPSAAIASRGTLVTRLASRPTRTVTLLPASSSARGRRTSSTISRVPLAASTNGAAWTTRASLLSPIAVTTDAASPTRSRRALDSGTRTRAYNGVRSVTRNSVSPTAT
jgi:hypothetical protein